MSTSSGADRDEWDVVVIGAGPPGENAAAYAVSEGGLSAVIVERELLGGECSYWACVPSKALLHPVEIVDAARHLDGLREPPLDVGGVLARRDGIVGHHDDSSQVEWAHGAGVDVLRGHGRLAGVKSVEVRAPDGAVRTITARQAVVLASGTRATIPPIDGLADAKPWTSRDVTNLHEVPSRVVVIGGGVVACEAATWLHGFGARRVTVVERGTRLLGRVEPFASDLVEEQFRDCGVDVRLGRKVERVARAAPADTGEGRIHGGPVTVTLDDGGEIEADEVLIAVGRTFNSDDVGLETVGVAANARGYVDVDEHLTVPGTDWLYVVGDLCGRALLTHMGKYQARVAGAVIAARAAGETLTGTDRADLADQGVVPQVIFTTPQVGAVGLTVSQARDAGVPVETVEYDLGNVEGAVLSRDGYVGRAALVIDSSTDTLVGAAFVGSGVAELVHSATVAIIGKVPVSLLWHAVPSFPTVSEIWLRLLETLREQRRG